MNTIFKIGLIFLLFTVAGISQAQNAGIGTLNPDPSARLEIASDSQGFLMPRLTTAQRVAVSAPAAGLMVFDSDTNTFWYFDGTVWSEINPSTPPSNSNLLFSILDQSGLNGTTESAIGSYVIPANTLLIDGEALEINAFGEITTDSSIIRFKAGPNALVFPVNVTGSWNAVIRIYRRNSGEIKMTGTLTAAGNSLAVSINGLQDLTAAAPFQITAQQDNAVNNGVTMEGFVITRIR